MPTHGGPGSCAVTWQWGRGGEPPGPRGVPGGYTQEQLLTNGPCPHPAEPSWCQAGARRVSRPFCLADTRVPVGVSEQTSGSWNSPCCLSSGQETALTGSPLE